MQKPPWERRGLKLPQERKKKRHRLKAKMQRRKGKNKFVNMFLSQLNVVKYLLKLVSELPSEDCPFYSLQNILIQLKAVILFSLCVLLLIGTAGYIFDDETKMVISCNIMMKASWTSY